MVERQPSNVTEGCAPGSTKHPKNRMVAPKTALAVNSRERAETVRNGAMAARSLPGIAA